jgi:hypothetical protein
VGYQFLVRAHRPVVILVGFFLWGCGAHRLSYPLGEPQTPRARFGSSYVLAIAGFADERSREAAGTRDFPDGRYRSIELPTAAEDVGRALARHLAFAGMFRKVVRAAPQERAHLLLSGEVRRLNIYAKDVRVAEVPARVEMELRLSVWRVDRKSPVWVRPLSIAFSRSYPGDLQTVTDLAFRDAMNEVVSEIGNLVGAYRSGPPHPIAEAP